MLAGEEGRLQWWWVSSSPLTTIISSPWTLGGMLFVARGARGLLQIAGWDDGSGRGEEE